jgi:2-(1,2-epoxy-1,2-dihydrophenyl)acetyl-CoA isomerase
MNQTIDTGTTHLLATLEEGVLTLTLNRPEARNAMSREMNQALEAQLAAAELDTRVRCVVLTGAGKGFCAGGDVKGMAASGDGTVGALTIDQAIHRQRANQRGTAGRLFKMPKPTIAALPGPAAGAGLSLALACDLRVMASTAIMTTAFARVGFSGDYGGTYFMTQLVGAAKARELYLLSPRVSAEEALKLGLANWVCAPDETGRTHRADRARPGLRPHGGLPLHEGKPQPRHGGRRRRLPRPRGDAPRALRPDRRPPRGQPRLRREARARVPGALSSRRSRHRARRRAHPFHPPILIHQGRLS